MRKGKLLLFDGLLALLLIVGISSCDKVFNAQKEIAKTTTPAASFASFCCNK